MGIAQIYGTGPPLSFEWYFILLKHSDAFLSLGCAKHALGYSTPTYSSNSAMAELTELSDAQRTVELVDWITWVLMTPANGLIKLSSIFLYRRIFVTGQEKLFNILSWTLIVVCALWTVAFFFATIFGCGRHFDYPWGPLVAISSCNTNIRLEGLMISDLITDLFVWMLPVPMVSLGLPIPVKTFRS